jgi:hypothetical protein
MTNKISAIAITAMYVIATTAAMASSRHHGHHTHAARTPAYPMAAAPDGSGEPHMIEARPGVWISSWDCITDEGNGRWMPCSAGSRSGRH